METMFCLQKVLMNMQCFPLSCQLDKKKKVTSMIHLAEGFRAKKNYPFGIQFRSQIGHVLSKKESIWSTSLHMENDIVVFRILGTSKNFQKITSNSIPKVYQNHLKYRENK